MSTAAPRHAASHSFPARLRGFLRPLSMTCLALACLALAGCGDGGADELQGPMLSGVVFYNGNCDGIRAPGDLRLHDINVHLYRADTQELLATTQTGADGVFTFHDGSLAGGVPAGLALRVGVSLSESGGQILNQMQVDALVDSVYFASPNEGADDTIDSDAETHPGDPVLDGSIPIAPLHAHEVVESLGVGLCGGDSKQNEF